VPVNSRMPMILDFGLPFSSLSFSSPAFSRYCYFVVGHFWGSANSNVAMKGYEVLSVIFFVTV